MKKPYRLLLDRKTGFRNVSGNPIEITDRCGRPFYNTSGLENRIWTFNLPPGEYYVKRGKIQAMPQPVSYELTPLPPPERTKRANPEYFHIQTADNPRLCTVDWNNKTITFDTKLCELPTPCLIFILFHEYGHRYYQTEEYCDIYASNRMLESGYNPEQIAAAHIEALSSKQVDRKSKVVDAMLNTGVNHFDGDRSNAYSDKNYAIGKYNNIQWSDEPVLDGWGWGDYWGPEHWIMWHKKLTERWGRERANEVFIEWYHKAGIGAASYDWRSFDPTFIAYAKDNGFYDALFVGIGGLLAKVVSTATQATGDTLNATQDIVQGGTTVIGNVGRNIGIALGIAGAVLVLLVYLTIKNRP